MKKLKKLNLEGLSNSKFDSLAKDQMAKFTGGTSYCSSNTMTIGNKGTSTDDGKDELD